MKLLSLLIASLLATFTSAQLSGSVGPTTDLATKQGKKTCNITSYGAKYGSDVGPALLAAWKDCKAGGVVVVPSGTWTISTWVLLNGGSGWALQLDGTITRDTSATAGGNMIFIEHTSDVEVFSSTGAGAILGNGYEMHKSGSISGPRLLRFYDVDGFSVHDIKLVDSPSFHFSMDTCKNGEVYNMLVRGGDHGGLDGIDVWSENIYIHDIMVTNKDECVTVKSPAHNILIENIYCNWSGGSALGSLGASVDISSIHYRNIYTVSSNQMLMIKSNGGSGHATDLLFENFIGHSNAYSLDIDQYWSSMSVVEGPGVALNNVTFRNWKGTESNGVSRGPIKILCADGAPCVDVVLDDFAMWTENGSKQVYTCRSAYGSGSGPVGAACLKGGSGGSYVASTMTVSAAPSGYAAATMDGDLKSAFGFTVSIPTPTWPSSFYPGVTPVSRLAGVA